MSTPHKLEIVAKDKCLTLMEMLLDYVELLERVSLAGDTRTHDEAYIELMSHHVRTVDYLKSLAEIVLSE